MNEDNEKLTGEYKFNNCAHRSAEVRTTLIRRCACQGGDYQDTGYDCSVRGIFKVDQEVCEHCYMFTKKSESQN